MVGQKAKNLGRDRQFSIDLTTIRGWKRQGQEIRARCCDPGYDRVEYFYQ